MENGLGEYASYSDHGKLQVSNFPVAAWRFIDDEIVKEPELADLGKILEDGVIVSMHLIGIVSSDGTEGVGADDLALASREREVDEEAHPDKIIEDRMKDFVLQKFLFGKNLHAWYRSDDVRILKHAAGGIEQSFDVGKRGIGIAKHVDAPAGDGSAGVTAAGNGFRGVGIVRNQRAEGFGDLAGGIGAAAIADNDLVCAYAVQRIELADDLCNIPRFVERRNNDGKFNLLLHLNLKIENENLGYDDCLALSDRNRSEVSGGPITGVYGRGFIFRGTDQAQNALTIKTLRIYYEKVSQSA